MLQSFLTFLQNVYSTLFGLTLVFSFFSSVVGGKEWPLIIPQFGIYC